jgi:hypothetical protein
VGRGWDHRCAAGQGFGEDSRLPLVAAIELRLDNVIQEPIVGYVD